METGSKIKSATAQKKKSRNDLKANAAGIGRQDNGGKQKRS